MWPNPQETVQRIFALEFLEEKDSSWALLSMPEACEVVNRGERVKSGTIIYHEVCGVANSTSNDAVV